jgi:hypothetical protein
MEGLFVDVEKCSVSMPVAEIMQWYLAYILSTSSQCHIKAFQGFFQYVWLFQNYSQGLLSAVSICNIESNYRLNGRLQRILKDTVTA